MPKVSFVSSGPGDPELLTLKALKRLQNAEVVLYDDLSSGAILDHANENADLIGVGKRAGRPSPKQDHVNQLLLKYARAGLKTVRLKSGDAGLFGRLEEEVSALQSEGIEYEIIPGVPSPLAALAEAGISFTRRLHARRVQFVTGHDLSGEMPEDLDFHALADPNASTAVFMGKRTFGKMAKRLIEAGLPQQTPVLIAENISRKDQKFVVSDLANADAVIRKETSDGPAVIFYGPIAIELIADTELSHQR